jgi:hypothetical protein
MKKNFLADTSYINEDILFPSIPLLAADRTLVKSLSLPFVLKLKNDPLLPLLEVKIGVWKGNKQILLM